MTDNEQMLGGDGVMVADLEVMAAANNYRNWMYSRMEPYIGQRILEVGAGIGNFTELLLDRELVVASDKYQMCVDYLQRRFGAQPKGAPAMQMDLAAPPASALHKYNFDTVICINVMEHVEDHAKALAFMHSVLVPGGRVILLVPAFQFLYGTIDRGIEHYRRYTKKDLLPRMREAGFEVERAFYMNVIGMVGSGITACARSSRRTLARFKISIDSSHRGQSAWSAVCRHRSACRSSPLGVSKEPSSHRVFFDEE